MVTFSFLLLLALVSQARAGENNWRQVSIVPDKEEVKTPAKLVDDETIRRVYWTLHDPTLEDPIYNEFWIKYALVQLYEALSQEKPNLSRSLVLQRLKDLIDLGTVEDNNCPLDILLEIENIREINQTYRRHIARYIELMKDEQLRRCKDMLINDIQKIMDNRELDLEHFMSLTKNVLTQYNKDLGVTEVPRPKIPNKIPTSKFKKTSSDGDKSGSKEGLGFDFISETKQLVSRTRLSGKKTTVEKRAYLSSDDSNPSDDRPGTSIVSKFPPIGLIPKSDASSHNRAMLSAHGKPDGRLLDEFLINPTSNYKNRPFRYISHKVLANGIVKTVYSFYKPLFFSRAQEIQKKFDSTLDNVVMIPCKTILEAGGREVLSKFSDMLRAEPNIFDRFQDEILDFFAGLKTCQHLEYMQDETQLELLKLFYKFPKRFY